MKLICRQTILACALAFSAAAHATEVYKVTENFETTPYGVYISGLYRSGMKVTRPLAYADGYPPGAFAVIDNTGAGALPGLGGNVLDSYAVLQDYTNAPWQIDFDRPVKTFRINVNDAPVARTTDVVWLKAWDNNGALVGQTRFKRSPKAVDATTLSVSTDTNLIYTVTFGSEQNGLYGVGLFWGSVVIEYEH